MFRDKWTNPKITINTIEEKDTAFTLIDLLIETANLLISSSQVKTLMILTYLNINSELLIKLVASNLSMCAERHPSDTCHP